VVPPGFSPLELHYFLIFFPRVHQQDGFQIDFFSMAPLMVFTIEIFISFQVMDGASSIEHH
jgi:hypothetical protein